MAALNALLLGTAQAQSVPADPAQNSGRIIVNQASASYRAAPNGPLCWSMSDSIRLFDTRGYIQGWAGGAIPDYHGYAVGLYRAGPSDPSGADLGQLLALAPTFPFAGGSAVSVEPNTHNVNPFPLSNAKQGTYGFLLSMALGQLEPGSVYLLMINPPPTAPYGSRRIRLVIGARGAGKVAYTASALDGLPIQGAADSSQGASTLPSGGDTSSARSAASAKSEVSPAGRPIQASALLLDGDLALINLNVSLYALRAAQITVTADQATAEPGDTLVYRVAVHNKGEASLQEIALTDTLPAGVHFIAGSVRAAAQGQSVPVVATRAGRSLLFRAPGTILPANQTLTLVYAVQVSPETAEGNALTSVSLLASAVAEVSGAVLSHAVTDGPSLCSVQIRPGILSDSGTLIGRVFVDTDGDGEQEPGEPGVPGAVIVLDTGDYVTADNMGLFSVSNLVAGPHCAVLDRTSIPGLAPAPNRHFIERGSLGRVVRLEAGGLVRVNFALVPTASKVTVQKAPLGQKGGSQ